MASAETGDGFKMWAVDNVVYGPVELPTLIAWVKDERVTSATWIYVERDNQWLKAASVSELQMFFRPKATPATGDTVARIAAQSSLEGIRPGSLRRVKILADLTDDQLQRFIGFMEVQKIKQWTEVVKQGDHGDAMYLMLEGELRVRMMISGKETILVTLGPGEFFGEISLFDHGPRSADVIANSDSLLLKISVSTFERLIHDAPDLAAPFLFAMGKTLTARIRADNKRYRDSVIFARTVGGA